MTTRENPAPRALARPLAAPRHNHPFAPIRTENRFPPPISPRIQISAQIVPDWRILSDPPSLLPLLWCVRSGGLFVRFAQGSFFFFFFFFFIPPEQIGGWDFHCARIIGGDGGRRGGEGKNATAGQSGPIFGNAVQCLAKNDSKRGWMVMDGYGGGGGVRAEYATPSITIHRHA